MANRYYAADEHRAARVRALFGHIAPRYDLINDVQSLGLHRLWKRRLVRRAHLSQGQRALDICCGTGDIAFALARVGAGVIGLDFSEPMLAVARRRAARWASGAPVFQQGDAQQLPFGPEQFDAVTVGYGLRNLECWEVGLREMHRVAKPGGRLLVLDFGKPDNLTWRAAYFGYLRWFVPVFGRIFCGDSAAYGYILESLNHYPAQRGVAAAMHELGCVNVRILNLLGGVMSINYGEKASHGAIG